MNLFKCTRSLTDAIGIRKFQAGEVVTLVSREIGGDGDICFIGTEKPDETYKIPFPDFKTHFALFQAEEEQEFEEKPLSKLFSGS